MSIEVGWLDNTETIVSQKFDADWTWDEFREASKTAAQLISTQEHPVHILADFGEEFHMPRGNAMMHSRAAINNSPENFGMLIILTRATLISAMVNMFLRVFLNEYKDTVYLTSSMEESMMLIERYTSLPE